MPARQQKLSSTRAYRVQLTVWEPHEVMVTAADEAAACADAEHMWNEIGPDALQVRDCGVEDIQMIPQREGDA